MVRSFTEQIDRLTSNADFSKISTQCMYDILGESPSLAVIYHMGGREALHDPKVFEKRLKDYFGDGANVILKRILKNLKTP